MRVILAIVLSLVVAFFCAALVSILRISGVPVPAVGTLLALLIGGLASGIVLLATPSARAVLVRACAWGEIGWLVVGIILIPAEVGALEVAAASETAILRIVTVGTGLLFCGALFSALAVLCRLVRRWITLDQPRRA